MIKISKSLDPSSASSNLESHMCTFVCAGSMMRGLDFFGTLTLLRSELMKIDRSFSLSLWAAAYS